MNRTDLDDKLYYIRNKSNKDNAEEMLSILDDIFEFKPVTILYFNVRGKVLCEIGKYEEAIEILQFKINLCFIEEEYLQTCKVLQEAYKAINNELYSDRWCYLELCINNILKKECNSIKKINQIEQNIINLEDKFLDILQDDKVGFGLANSYWKSWCNIEAIIMYVCAIRNHDIDLDKYKILQEMIHTEINYNFFLEQLLNKNGNFILVCNKENYERVMTIAKAIKLLNQKVYVIMPPVSVEVDNVININETINISMGNIKIDENEIKKIRPIEIVLNNEVIENNIYLLLEEIVKEDNEDFSMLIVSGNSFTSMNKIEKIEKRIQRLSEFKGEIFEENLIFGYYGSYISYISKLYSLDVRRELEKPSECKISIVIPTRNSVESLRYTLETCMEQRNMNENDYEIIISDNSTSEYTEIEEIIKEFNSPKIKYFKTPKKLALGRSFEYAFIKAKGEFIFSLGADDGLLPWGLEKIQQYLDELPNDDIVQWDRGFFMWPNNIKASNQAGQFGIPRAYNNKHPEIERYKSWEKLFMTLNNPNTMYGLPMLYINSGFRRRYIKKLFEYTGRLWDGGSQDVYIGIVNLIMYETIPHINLPITIAGMTASSVGIEGNSGYNKNKDYIKSNNRMISDYGNIVPYNKQLKSICVSLDISLLYSSFFRALNVCKSDMANLIADKLDLKDIFKIVSTMLNCNNLRFDYDIQMLRYSAYYNNFQLGEWFDNNIVKFINQPKIMEENIEKNYEEGFTFNGGLQLDSRKFGVSNIYQATKFFENICNL